MMGFIVFRIKPERNALIIAQLAVPEDGPTCPLISTDSRRLTSTHVDSHHMSHMSQMPHISQMSQSHIIRAWHRNIAAWASVVCC